MTARVLVTGSSGFIGSHLVDSLRRQGVSHDGLDLRPSQWTNVVGDIRDFDASRYDLIYHLASLTDVRESVERPHDYFDTIVWGTTHLLERFRGRMVFVSSAYADTRRSPYHCYKWLAERIVLDLCEKPFVVGLANVYGPRGRSVINRFLAATVCDVYGGGNQTRDFVWVGDVVEALIGLTGRHPGRREYIGTGTPTSLNRLVSIMGKPVRHLPANPADIVHPVFKTTIRCSTSIEEGLRIMEAMK